MNFQDLIMSDYLILIPFFYVIGLFLKQINFHDNRLIPTTLGILGIVFGFIFAYAKFDNQAHLHDLINGVIQGVFCAGMSVFGNEFSSCLSDFLKQKK